MSAISSYKRIGVTKSLVHHLAINYFHYPAEYLDTLEHYYIHHWNPQYVAEIIENGTIVHNDISYLVVYQNCTPFTVFRSKQDIRLSFRVVIPDFNIPAYVIVRLANE